MKINKQTKIEINNLKEEISEMLEPCVKCGLCKSNCPVFKIISEEEISPRGHSIKLSNKRIEQIVFTCNLCKSCEKNCPLDLKICDAIRKAREVLSLQDKNTKPNQEMIKNIKETGNPFGKNPEKKNELYCC
jgi:Fe-S oxidoreductase